MHKIYTILTFIFIGNFGFSQSVKGTLIDQETQDVIPFATVQIGDDYGVITNAEGVFNINTERFTKNDSLLFSFLGYESQKIAIKDFNNDILGMKPIVNTLGNVYLINNNIDPLKILDSVKANIPRNYRGSNTKLTTFQREKKTTTPTTINFEIKKADFIDKKTIKDLNQELASLSANSINNTTNTYYDTFMEIYKGEDNAIKLDLKKGTKLFNREKSLSSENIQNKVISKLAERLKSGSTFKVRTGIIPIGDSLDLKSSLKSEDETIKISEKKSAVSRTLKNVGFGEDSSYDFIFEPKKYSYQLTNVVDYNEKMVYVIEFSPDRNSAKYTGELYVNAEDYAVLKIKYKLADGKVGQNVNLKFLLGIKYRELGKEALVLYQQTSSGYKPKFIKTTTNTYSYFNRSLTFIENKDKEYDPIKIKFDILSESKNRDVLELVVLETQAITSSSFAAFSEIEKQNIEVIEKYNAEIWKSFTIIAPDQAIKEFDY